MENTLSNSNTAAPALSGAVLQLARFIAIGGLNTALDFLVLNMISSSTGINSGVGLGAINVVSFSIALIHSYFWNRAWTFGNESGFTKTIVRAFVLCVLAVLGLGFAVFASKMGYGLVPFAIALVVFLGLEVVFWVGFGVKSAPENRTGVEFAKFLGVSGVGLAINSVILSIGSILLMPYAGMLGGEALVKNIAKALATGVSLIWNFLGYKIFVFKK